MCQSEIIRFYTSQLVVNNLGKKVFSVIIPIYNIGKNTNALEHTLRLLRESKTALEVILINDGSTDDSAAVCKRLTAEFDFVSYELKPHTGVSDTRNVGVKKASGKYIMYIDSDDTISPDSIEKLYSFFEECYDEIDMVTYPIETHYKGQVLAPHFRYKTMTYTGIYDLNVLPYIGQTTMNIVVKNKFRDNILFDTDMTFSEDQDYCSRVLKDKMKIGFCKEAKYIYNRSEDSSSGRISGSCYVFEQSMKMFENMFFGYDEVPKAFQGLYINDLEWKMRSELLYPYHYDKEHFDTAVKRIRSLLNKVDNDVILEHPDIDLYHKYYWLRMKDNIRIQPFYEEKRYGLRCGGKELISENKMQIVITRIRADNEDVIICGYLKSVVLNFRDYPELYALDNGKEKRIGLEISSAGYYLCHTETNRFYAFRYISKASELNHLRFRVKMGGIKYDVTYYFMPEAPFDHSTGIYDAAIGKYHISYDTGTGEYSVSQENISAVLRKNTENYLIQHEIKKLRSKAVKLIERKRIWLYYDCMGVKADNGYYRFLNDIQLNDSIERYYVYTQDKKVLSELFASEHKKMLIAFGSKKHKEYFLACEKIVTAYIEHNNIIPFDICEYRYICDFFRFNIDYLQHGILHAVMPWKYSYEKNLADRVYVSTEYERELFTGKYGYRQKDVISEIMPRFRQYDKNSVPKKKILFAPSWRKYLVGRNIKGIWERFDDKFISSDFYKNIMSFINSSELERFLCSKGYVMDFKLHPVFQYYYDCMDITNRRVSLIHEAENLEDYEILITDFSSFMFDFIYMERKVFSYIPDKDQFYCGMNSYREIEKESRNVVIEINSISEFIERFDEKNDYSGMRFVE